MTTINLQLRCASCNAELYVQHISMTAEAAPAGDRIVAVKPHVCPPEVPVAEPCDLTEGCCRKGTPLDATTHVIYVQSDEANVVLASLNFHPECCPHWLAGAPCDKRHGG